MTQRDIAKYREQLQNLATRILATSASAEDQARSATGGEAAGDLSNAPIHLADVGSEVMAQELGATLLENERYLQGEISAALDRIDQNTFGKCEHCGKVIAQERLRAVPYARYCVRCAEALDAGREVNMNEGRPKSWAAGIGLRQDGPPEGAPGGPPETPTGDDTHAAGTPGGGTAIGGLAGTNLGAGEPREADLEDAMGSSEFDAQIETEPVQELPSSGEPSGGFAGHAGGAVGGTPANKRAVGGRAKKNAAKSPGRKS
jgi:RNA polymerase-binding transcription factor DksA